MTPTGRSLALLREMNYEAEVVERWNRFSKTRHDLFGCIDIVACHPDFGILGVQATTTSNAAAREKKALEEPRLLTWLQAGGRFSVHGWAKRGAKGQRKLWTLSERKIDVGTLQAALEVRVMVGNKGQCFHDWVLDSSLQLSKLIGSHCQVFYCTKCHETKRVIVEAK